MLDDRLKDYEKEGNFEVEAIRDDVKDLEKKARKQYNKAENLEESAEIISMLDLAKYNQEKAIGQDGAGTDRDRLWGRTSVKGAMRG